MNGLVGSMNGGVGRAARVLLGVALVYLGFGVMGGTSGAIVAVVGVLPVVLGFWGRCLLELFAPRAAAKGA